MGRVALTAEIARFIASAPHAQFSPDVLASARRAFIDTIGVMLAGRNEPAVRLLNDCCIAGDEAVALAVERRLPARDAALIDGTAGHVLDYDDVSLHGHASVVLIPAIMAEAQRLAVPDVDALKAYVIGYEVWAELTRREADTYHLGSWHPTSMLGAIAATAAVAAVGRLDQTRTRHALAIAASFASGVIANFGTHTKPLQVGRAAAAGIDAVRLARAGLEGAADALEGRSGLLMGLSPRGRVDVASPMRYPDSGWQLLNNGVSVKCYPVCHATHRAVDGVIELMRGARLAPAEIASVTVGMAMAPARTVDNARPMTGLEAKFSLQHNVSAALLDGQLGFAQLTDAFVRRDDVVALYGLTGIQLRDDRCPEQPGMAKHDRVLIETRSGRRLDSGDIRYPRGHAKLPLSDTELDAKFMACAGHGKYENAGALLARLHRLDHVEQLAGMSDHGL